MTTTADRWRVPANEGVTVIDREIAPCPPLPLIDSGNGSVRALVWPGVGARLRSMHEFSLEVGARTVEQSHDGEAVYYIVSGCVDVHDLGEGRAQRLVAGAMAHVEPATRYLFSAVEPTTLVGGPCPVDDSLYAGIDR